MKMKRNWKRLVAILCGAAMVCTMFSGVDFKKVEATTAENDKKVITSCDSTDGITLNGAARVVNDAKYVREGSGAFYVDNPGQVVFEVKFSNPVDIAAYKQIHLSLYIGDTTHWNGDIKIDISSAQNPDKNRIRLTVAKNTITNGWNELNLTVGEDTSSTGFDKTGLNYIRIFQSSGNALGGNVIASVDDIYAYNQPVEVKGTVKEYTSGTITGGIAPKEEDYDSASYVFGGWFKNYDASAEKEEQFTDPLSKGETVTATAENPVYAKLVPAKVLSSKAQSVRNENNKKIIANCDSTDGIVLNNHVSITTEAKYVKEGTGAFHFLNPGRTVFEMKFSNPVDISAYEVIHLSLYIEDTTYWNGLLRINISSDQNPDKECVKWTIEKSTLAAGWNELNLTFAEAANISEFDSTGLNYIKIWQGAGDAIQQQNINAFVDDIYATREFQGKTLFNCDETTANILNTTGTINREQTYVKEGTGSLRNASNSTELAFTLKNPVDITSYQNGSLHFWLYIEDTSKITGIFYVDLTSAGTNGAQQLRWYMTSSRLQTGWNELYLPLANPREYTSGDKGVFEPSKANYFRIYWSGSATGIYLDNVTVVDAVYLMTAHNTAELCGSNNVGVTITNENGEFAGGTGAYANKNSKAKVRHAAQVRLLGYTDTTAYKIADKYQANGAVHFWLKISNLSAWQGDMTVQLSSSASEYENNNLQWTVKKEYLKEGWNELYLNLSQASTTGTVDFTNMNFFRVMMAEDSVTNFDTILDDVSIVANDAETVSMRFVSTVDSLQYKEIKLKIEKSGSSSIVCEPSKTVYSALYAVGSNNSRWEEVPTIFHSESKYFFTQTITNMPVRVFDSVFTVTPYWVTLDGTEVQGIPRTYTLNQAISVVNK